MKYPGPGYKQIVNAKEYDELCMALVPSTIFNATIERGKLIIENCDNAQVITLPLKDKKTSAHSNQFYSIVWANLSTNGNSTMVLYLLRKDNVPS